MKNLTNIENEKSILIKKQDALCDKIDKIYEKVDEISGQIEEKNKEIIQEKLYGLKLKCSNNNEFIISNSKNIRKSLRKLDIEEININGTCKIWMGIYDVFLSSTDLKDAIQVIEKFNMEIVDLDEVNKIIKYRVEELVKALSIKEKMKKYLTKGK